MPRNPEVMQAEAITELRHRLERRETAEEPQVAAQEFVRWMIREGWRPVGHRVEPVDPNRVTGPTAPPPTDYQAARAALGGAS